MLKVYAKTARYVIDLNLFDTLTLVSGDSGTGKTFLCHSIQVCKDVNMIKVKADNNMQYIVNVVNSLNDLRCLLQDGCPHLIFIDKMEQWDVVERKIAEDLIISDLEQRVNYNYYVVMYRGVSRLGFVEPMYILDYSNNVFKFVVGGQHNSE